jgi:hypothetical protein
VRGSVVERVVEVEVEGIVVVVEGGAARNAEVVARYSRRMLCFNVR